MGKDQGLLKEAGLELKDLFLLKQVHGDRVIELREGVDIKKNLGTEADAILSLIPNTPIAIKTADCVPILFAHADGMVGAVHAGWRGSAQGVLFRTLKVLEQDFHIKPNELKMGIGPTICQDHYEVGVEVAGQFSDIRYPGVLKPHGVKSLLNLQRVNLLQALEAGVSKQNVEVFSHCTFEEPEWHSYRRAVKAGEQEAGRNYSWIFFR
jgi:hypothetical protein